MKPIPYEGGKPLQKSLHFSSFLSTKVYKLAARQAEALLSSLPSMETTILVLVARRYLVLETSWAGVADRYNKTLHRCL